MLMKNIEKCPHEWVKEAGHYFTNATGDCWFAKRTGEHVVFTSSDIDFEEIDLTVNQSIIVKEAFTFAMRQVGPMFLKTTQIDKDEALWILSVIESEIGGNHTIKQDAI